MKKWLVFWGDRKVRVSLWFLAVMVIVSIILPQFPAFFPNKFDPNHIIGPQSPSLDHWFGTDDLGRDIFSRIIYGARISLSIGFVSVGIAIAIGMVLGVVSGYLGGWFDECLMRLVDLFMAIPTIFLILTIQSMLTPNIYNVMIIIGLTSWMDVCRLVRAEVLSLKERPFMLAARARGLTHRNLIFKQLLPHTLNPIIVAATLGIGGAILTESVISFLGLGVQPPQTSWGNMLENSLSYVLDAPWMIAFPGIFITITVLALNFIGDGLRVAFNPREYHA